MIGLHALARYAAPRPPTSARCELCSGPLGEHHHHVLERDHRALQCACRACGILFARGDRDARYRTIPDRVRTARRFDLTSAEWAELGVPVALAFCVRDSVRGGIVCYPGPAGVVEGELEPATWAAIAAATELADELEPDVEALLVRGQRGDPKLAAYLVPISVAYELVARLRTVWEGFTGGAAADRELAAFFTDLDRNGGRA